MSRNAHKRPLLMAGPFSSLVLHTVILIIMAPLFYSHQFEEEPVPIQSLVAQLELEDERPETEIEEPELIEVAVQATEETVTPAELENIDFDPSDVGNEDVIDGDTFDLGGGPSATMDDAFDLNGSPMVAAAIGVGPGAGVTFFKTTTSSERRGAGPVFIIDMSASMSDDQMAVLKNELSESLRNLTAAHLFNVIFFSGPAWLVGEDSKGALRQEWQNDGAHDFWRTDNSLPTVEWERGTSRTKQRFLQYLTDLPRSFGTDWRPPFQMAYAMNPPPTAIFFLTDGSVSNPQETLDLVDTKREIPVHTIAYGLRGRGVEALAEMSRLTRGSHVAYDKDEISRLAARLAAGEDIR